MKTLTIEERHEVYKAALVRIKNIESDYICVALKSVIYGTFDIKTNLKNIVILFPELKQFKPVNKSIEAAWWPNSYRKSRIDCLTKCIELTAPKNETL